MAAHTPPPHHLPRTYTGEHPPHTGHPPTRSPEHPITSRIRSVLHHSSTPLHVHDPTHSPTGPHSNSLKAARSLSGRANHNSRFLTGRSSTQASGTGPHSVSVTPDPSASVPHGTGTRPNSNSLKAARSLSERVNHSSCVLTGRSSAYASGTGPQDSFRTAPDPSSPGPSEEQVSLQPTSTFSLFTPSGLFTIPPNSRDPAIADTNSTTLSVMTWTHFLGYDSVILGIFLDAVNNLETVFQVSELIGNQTSSSVITLVDGGVIVGFQRQGCCPGDSSAMIQKLTRRGIPIGSAIQVNDRAFRTWSFTVIHSGDGGYGGTWVRLGNDLSACINMQIVARFFTRDSLPKGDEFLLASGIPGLKTHLTGIEIANDVYAYAWSGMKTSDELGIYLVIATSNGTILYQASCITCDLPGAQSSPSLARHVKGEDGAILVYDDSIIRSIIKQRLWPNGTLSNPEPLDPGTEYEQTNPAISRDANGFRLISRCRDSDTNGNGVCLRQLDASASSIGSAERISLPLGTIPANPAIATTAGVWEARDGQGMTSLGGSKFAAGFANESPLSVGLTETPTETPAIEDSPTPPHTDKKRREQDKTVDMASDEDSYEVEEGEEEYEDEIEEDYGFHAQITNGDGRRVTPFNWIRELGWSSRAEITDGFPRYISSDNFNRTQPEYDQPQFLPSINTFDCRATVAMINPTLVTATFVAYYAVRIFDRISRWWRWKGHVAKH